MIKYRKLTLLKFIKCCALTSTILSILRFITVILAVFAHKFFIQINSITLFPAFNMEMGQMIAILHQSFPFTLSIWHAWMLQRNKLLPNNLLDFFLSSHSCSVWFSPEFFVFFFSLFHFNIEYSDFTGFIYHHEFVFNMETDDQFNLFRKDLNLTIFSFSVGFPFSSCRFMKRLPNVLNILQSMPYWRNGIHFEHNKNGQSNKLSIFSLCDKHTKQVFIVS